MFIEVKNVTNELAAILKKYISVKDDKLVSKEVNVKKLSFLQLRDAIWRIGRIIVELEDEYIYIAAVKSGMMMANTAYLAIKLTSDILQIVGYAKEGLFSQLTVENAINQLNNVLIENDA